MIEYANYDKAFIVTGDGDFSCLIERLISKGKLIVPDRDNYSLLLAEQKPPMVFMNGLRGKLEYDVHKKKTSPKDKTFWIASHRNLL
jgi:hypothetical protein